VISASGQTRRFRDVPGMSGLPQTADISRPGRHFAFVPNADIGSDPMADVRDVESGKVQATRELFGADQPLNDGGSLRLALRPSLWSASGVRLLRCRAEMTANIIKRDWRRLGKRWQWDRGLEYLSNFYQRLFEITVPLKNQSRRKAILLPFAKRAANGRIHCQ